MASFIILSVLVLIASCAIYCFENDAQPEKFASIIHSFWCAVITMTTVGYGDIYPVTVGGKIIASLFSAIGFGFIALPVLSQFKASIFHNLIREYFSRSLAFFSIKKRTFSSSLFSQC
jgi:hypothetical protein